MPKKPKGQSKSCTSPLIFPKPRAVKKGFIASKPEFLFQKKICEEKENNLCHDTDIAKNFSIDLNTVSINI